MNEDKSLTTRKEHALTKSQHTGGLIDKHLSNLLDQHSPNVQTIECEDGIYVGELLDGIPHGQGTWTHPDGDKYVGEYKDGERYRGTFTFGEGEFEGEKFVGEFKDEEWWNGTLYDSEGNVVDTWSEGEPE